MAHTDEVQPMYDHSIEPEPGTIREGRGEYIGDDAARCMFCLRRINGNENGWYHVEEEEGDE